MVPRLSSTLTLATRPKFDPVKRDAPGAPFPARNTSAMAISVSLWDQQVCGETRADA
jgi:hypothetical protein